LAFGAETKRRSAEVATGALPMPRSAWDAIDCTMSWCKTESTRIFRHMPWYINKATQTDFGLPLSTFTTSPNFTRGRHFDALNELTYDVYEISHDLQSSMIVYTLYVVWIQSFLYRTSPEYCISTCLQG
jgi:hypothetical protein